MTTTTDRPPTADMPQGPRSLKERTPNARGRARRDALMRAVLLGCLVLALIPLALILWQTIRIGSNAFGWEFLTETTPFSRRREGGGFLQGFVGTMYMVAIATAISVPLGVLASVFLVEFKSAKLAAPVRFFTDVMTGVPSIFVGLFVYSALVRDAGLGFGTFVGGVALSILMLPIVVRSGEEILKLVPNDLRAASYGLGARRWQTVFKVVLPAAAPGLITGSFLAVARAAGETAPLLLTAFGAFTVVTELQGTPQSALSVLIFEAARSPFAADQARGWAGALQLVLIVLLFTVAARWVGSRGSLKQGR